MKKYIFTNEQMKEIDNYVINSCSITSLTLMENAAKSVVKNIDTAKSVLVVCKTGNNGADGLAIARLLLIQGIDTKVYIIEGKHTPEYDAQYNMLKEVAEKNGLGCVITDSFVGEYDVLIDAMLGIGFKGELNNNVKEVIDYVNNNKYKMVIAVDIPSGGLIRADKTITFGFRKLCMMFYPVKANAGQIIVEDIGYPKEAIEYMLTVFKASTPYMIFTYENEDLALLPERIDNSNKGTYGKVLVIAGSKGMAGAAYLSSMSCLRVGAGLVRIMSEEINRSIIQTTIPEALFLPYDDAELGIKMIIDMISKSDVIIVGPGLSMNATKEIIVKLALESKKPIVVDADALNCIAKNKDLINYYHENVIITPHVAEMARLTGNTAKDNIDRIIHNPIEVAYDYANRYKITCVLKDAVTTVATQDKVFINNSGNNGMSTAGSGDVLSGIIGGLVATGLDTATAAALGVYVHGLAGDKAVEEKSKRSIIATDIINNLYKVV